MGKTTEKMWLAKMSLNWADEANFTYYEIIADSDKQKYEEYLSKYKDVEVMKCFGTNEESYLTGEEIDGSIEWFEIPSDEVLKFVEDAVVEDAVFDFGGGEISEIIRDLAENGGEDFDDDDRDECDCDDCEECDDDDEED